MERFKYLINAPQRMVLWDLVNIGAGAYKGYVNASGVHVNPNMIWQTVGTTSAVAGLAKYLSCRGQENYNLENLQSAMFWGMFGMNPKLTSPIGRGIKRGLAYIPIGAIEFGIGYATGYITQKIIS